MSGSVNSDMVSARNVLLTTQGVLMTNNSLFVPGSLRELALASSIPSFLPGFPSSPQHIIAARTSPWSSWQTTWALSSPIGLTLASATLIQTFAGDFH